MRFFEVPSCAMHAPLFRGGPLLNLVDQPSDAVDPFPAPRQPFVIYGLHCHNDPADRLISRDRDMAYGL